MPQYFDADRQTVRRRVRTLMQNATDEGGQPLFPNLDAPGSPGYTIREVLTRLVQRQGEQLNSTIEDFSPLTARGRSLDDWAEYLGMSRTEASDANGRAVIYADVDGATVERLSQSRVIEKGTQLQAGTIDLRTTEQVRLPEAGTEVEVGVEAVGVRSGTALESGAELEIPTRQLLSARTSTDISGGRTREEDDQLRYRLARAMRAPSTFEGLEAQLLSHPDVSDIEIRSNEYGPGTTEVFVKPAVSFPTETLRQELESLAEGEGPGEVFVLFPSYEGLALRIQTTDEVVGADQAVADLVANLEAGQQLVINEVEDTVRDLGTTDAKVVGLRRGAVGDDRSLTNPRTVRSITNAFPKTPQHQWYTRPSWVEIC